MESQPLISVVLCTYNGEQYVSEQLSSILSQTYTSLEIIICDDVSTDKTFIILKNYAEKDKRIKLYLNDTNLGYNKNFEQAIKLAKADWIAIADQDDIWLPEKIMELRNCITEDVILVHSHNAEFKDDPSVTAFNPSRLRFSGSNVRQLIFYNTVSGHAMMFHKKLLDFIFPFPEGVYYDWWIALNAAVHGEIALCNKQLVLHRQHSSNSSHISKQLSPKEAKADFFEQRIHSLKSFRQLRDLKKEDVGFLDSYISLVDKERKKAFSFPAFIFFLKHARTAFYYRQKTPMWFYYFKYSLKKASMKVKNWT